MGADLARDFKRFGNRKALIQDWSKVIMTDKDLYSGYPYAAINNRANAVARMAKYNLKTGATDQVQKAAKDKDEEIRHPYLDIIDSSKTFSNNKFWYDISTFLDLEGVYYLLVVRNVQAGGNANGTTRVGNVTEFQLLNPYNIRRIIDKETLKIGGYVETKNGMVRELPVPMVIEMRKLNPFSEEDPYAMVDAAKESQFTIKQAGDYTRHSLKNNMAAPGIISTDVLLDTQQFQNFVSRVTNQEKGLPLFGNGAGAITWDSMQIDLDKAGLKDINEMNRQALFAVSGVGKTMMSIEESGTTRDTATAQKEIFIENHVIPQTELIIDALNQDYKVYYEAEYQKQKYELIVDNPLSKNIDAEIKDVDKRDAEYKLYDSLVAMGYRREIASKYASGDITLEELGDPTEEARPNPIIEAAKLKVGDDPKNANIEPPKKDPKAQKKSKQEIEADKLSADLELVNRIADFLGDKKKNEFDEESQGLVQQQQAALQNAVIGIQGRVINSIEDNVFKVNNDFSKESDVMTEEQKKEYIKELALVLGAFYGILIPLFAKSTLSSRLKEFGLSAIFKLDKDVKSYIKEISNKAAESHISTIVDDVRETIDEQYKLEIKNQVKLIEETGRAVTDEDLQLARKRALEGASRQRILNEIKNEYNDKISDMRARAIARTETNRAFTQSQFQADTQFIIQNNLEDKAYKQWTTRSDNPCAICQSLAAEPPIPFFNDFAKIGDELIATYKIDGKTKVQKQLVNFEDLTAGNAHVNCSCRYILIIKN